MADLQRTDEWFADRLGKVTASRIADVRARTKTGWGAARKNYMADLIAERLSGEHIPGGTGAARRWGSEIEPEAKRAYEFYSDAEIVEVGFIPHPTIGDAGASPARADTPALANNFLKAMKALFDWAVRNDHIDVNPAAGVERVRYKTEGFPAWTVEDYRQFCDRWPVGTKPRLAVELILHTGLRRSDIVHLGRQHIKGRTVTITTAKTGMPITAEIPAYVMEVIEASPTGDLALLASETGRPFTKESFGNWFRDQCSAAGISKSAHGIRKLAATLAADGGAPAHELMAQFGWTNIKQAEVYTRGADRKALGVKSSRRISSQLRVRDTRRKAK